jgi:hypothetical protein
MSSTKEKTIKDSYNYKYINSGNLKSALLIELRNEHTAIIAEELVKSEVVPREYLDKLLRLDKMKKTNTISMEKFSDYQRIEKLIELVQKHSIASTASFIGNLYT